MRSKIISGCLGVLVFSLLISSLAYAVAPGGYPGDINTGDKGGRLRIRGIYGSAILIHDLYYSLDGGTTWRFVCVLSDAPHVCTTNEMVPPHTQVSLRIKVWNDPRRNPNRDFVRNLDYIFDSSSDSRYPVPGELDSDGDPAPRIIDHYHDASDAASCGLGPLDVSAIHVSTSLLGLVCFEDWSDFDWDDSALAVDFEPGSEVTPTPEPPQLRIHVRDTSGQPVILPIGQSRFAEDVLSGTPVDVVTQLWGWSSDASGPIFSPDPTRPYVGAYIRLNYPGQEYSLVSATALPGCALADYETSGTFLRFHSGWQSAEWVTGVREVTFVVSRHATPTPTSTSTSTRTPTPTSASTPTPTRIPSTSTATPTSTPTSTPTPRTPTPAPSWDVHLPGGDVFVHVYEPGMARLEQGDFRTDELIALELQRWAGLAPIYRPDTLPQLCQGSLCYEGTLVTTQFRLSHITNLTYGYTQGLAFDYPRGRAVDYVDFHARGDTNYQVCEYMWLLVLSQGGLMPPAASASACPQAIARIGYPGTYRIEGTLYLEATWRQPVNYAYRWSIPIAFYVTQNAPYPH